MEKLEFNISSKIYNMTAVTNTSYKFSDKYYIQLKAFPEEHVKILVQPKKEGDEISKDFQNLFLNELLDQQVRVNIEKDFGHIRDMIVKKAFFPINE